MKQRLVPLSARTRLARALATFVAVTATLALATVAGCESQQDPKLPSVQDKIRDAGLNGKEKLRIGVAVHEPLMAVQENGAYSGFDIEIARYIATSLGFAGNQRLEFVPLTTEDRIPALQGGRVDLVVASFSMTPERAQLVNFAGPYLVTTQEVMIPVGMKDKIRTMEDLQDPQYRVCASGGSTTETGLKQRGVRVLVETTTTDCLNAMREGRYHAMSSDETILAGFRSRYPTEFEILDLPFGTSEQLGIGVSITNKALRDLVAHFLSKSYQAQERGESTAWLAAYHKHLGPWMGEARQPPPQNVPELIDFDDKAPQR